MEEHDGQPVESLKIAEKPKEEQVFQRSHRYLSPLNIMFLTSQKEESWGLIFLRPAVFLVTLPLYIIPVAGPAMFLSIQAVFKGGETHKRYFAVYKWTDTQRERRVEYACWQYYRFGMIATLLEMVPFAGFLFSYTNQIGAAMWAMDLHDRNLIQPKSL
ncbi:hypothetical protein EC973_005000 [Apophysomyces ossiformis]|uniref:Uncharacterized protein n=1 Tax=Apophysomyces ossiformis TaxID=679940 RepID=A0A8H7BJX1_9FUNG|nr:hypothetical protein EC973_005000 [Apophysomyces ossiformis]